MKLALLGMIAALFFLNPQQTPLVATHVTAADIQATLDQMSPTAVNDRQIRMVDVGGYSVGVGILRRPGTSNQSSISHDKITEVYVVLKGEGTLVTGGQVDNPRPLSPTSATYRELAGPGFTGQSMEGGQSRRVGPGDAVIIPPSVPHWFSDISSDLEYIVIRMDPEQVLELK
jgi:mannose-6-phosphate isomerase-like protein (cupin superfamily)